jgi:hypothetical protein
MSHKGIEEREIWHKGLSVFEVVVVVVVVVPDFFCK